MTGLFGKYIVQKADGSLVDPNAEYFVLRLDTDIAARIAVRAYIQELNDGDDLKQNLIDWVKRLDEKDHKNAMRRQAARYGDGAAWEEHGRS